MTQIALLQTDLTIAGVGLEVTRYGLSSPERDTVVGALGKSEILICDMNLLREDSYRLLMDIRPELNEAISSGARLICLTTRPTIRTSAGAQNVYSWIPFIGDTVTAQDDLVTKVVSAPKNTGPALPDAVMSSLFATCAFVPGSLGEAVPFLVSEDQTPVGIIRKQGSGFVMLLPQSEDKRALLSAVIEWAKDPEAVSGMSGDEEVALATDLDAGSTTIEDVVDLGAPAGESVEASSAADLSVELVGESEGENVMDLGQPSDLSPAAETGQPSGATAVAPGEDVFSRRLNSELDEPAGGMASVVSPEISVPLSAESEEFDKAFDLNSPDPFRTTDIGNWPEPGPASLSGEKPVPVDAPPQSAPVAVEQVIETEVPASSEGDKASADVLQVEEPEVVQALSPAAGAPMNAAASPDWLDEFHTSVPGIGEIVARQREILDQIKVLETENVELQSRKARVDSWLALVTGDPESFHRAIRNFFSSILSTSAEITGQGLITADAGIGKFLILPVASESMVKADVGRLLLHALADADVQTKGVIVVNQERDRNALQRSPIDPDLGELARKRDFAVIPSVLLYRVAVQHTLDADPPNVIDIVQQIYSSAGTITVLR